MIGRLPQCATSSVVSALAHDGSFESTSFDRVAEVRQAISDNRVFLAWQPVVDSIAPRIDHFHEGLLRILDTNGDLVPASAFIADVEDSTIGRELDNFALQTTVKMLRKCSYLSLSVNASALSLTNKEWISVLVDALLETPQIGHRLIIEVTETSALPCASFVKTLFETLGKFGVAFAMDDFGSGHTSRFNLMNLGFRYAKISREMISDALSNNSDAAVLYTLVKAARSSQINCIAEGVESEEAAMTLRSMGFFGMQGFYFGQPSLKICDRRSSLGIYRERFHSTIQSDSHATLDS